MKGFAGGRRGPIGFGLLVLLLAGLAALLARSGDAATEPATGHLSGVAAVAAGNFHTCVLTRRGAVECWGINSHGQLGDGTKTERHAPVAVSGLTSGVAAIAAGETHTCALTRAGAVKCWGNNESGQLGDGTTTDRSRPVAVPHLASGVIAITAGDEHTCAVKANGAAKCWGWNDSGQLGDGTWAERHAPVSVSGLTSGVVAIAAGGYYTCALTSTGAVECWGENLDGQLGDGTENDRRRPVAVSGLSSGVAAITAGFADTCALTSANALKCWGGNAFGELGDGTTTDHSTPVDVSGLSSGVTAMTVGFDHTCALTNAGAVECWGTNDSGELGDGTTTERHAPVAVSGLTGGVAAIAAGNGHTCAVTSTGVVECWGYNGSGQLGDGTTKERHRPVEVLAVGRACVVPNVIGNRLPRAKARLTRADCRVGKIRYEPSTQSKKGRVLAEHPGPHTKLANDAKVGLTVGRGPVQR